jgi:hypothetical protein
VRAEERETQGKRRSVWSSLGLAFGVLALLYLVGWGITGARIRGELARLRAHGEPVAPCDLVPKLTPGEGNAADVYEQAFALAPRQALACLFVNGPWQWSPSQVSFLRSIVNGNARYYELLEEASRIPACSFPVQWDEMGMVTAGEAGTHLFWAMCALEVKLRLQAHGGDLDGALATCGAQFGIVSHTDQILDWETWIAGSHEQDLAQQDLAEVLSCGDPSPAACRQLADLLASRDHRALLVRALKVQRVGQLSRMQWMERGRWFVQQPPRSARWVVRESYPVVAKPPWNADKERYLEVMAAYLEAAKRPWPEAGREVLRLDKHVKELFASRASPMALMAPSEGAAFGLAGRDAAMAGAWQIALALKAYHHDHGVYPASLSAVEHATWKLPLDPFTGNPYHYRRHGAGFIVWSVGSDRQDDGARPYPEGWNSLLTPGYDFVVRRAR